MGNKDSAAEWNARMKISDVLVQYCRGIDRLDKQILLDVYWPEAIDNHSIFNGPARDFVDFIMVFMEERYIATLHLLGQSTINISDDLAQTETYFQAEHQLRSGDGSLLERVGGRYLDKLACRSGEWKIIERTVVFDLFGVIKTVPQDVDTSLFLFGKKHPEDFSYRVLPR
jgi:hypothetical protein